MAHKCNGQNCAPSCGFGFQLFHLGPHCTSVSSCCHKLLANQSVTNQDSGMRDNLPQFNLSDWTAGETNKKLQAYRGSGICLWS